MFFPGWLEVFAVIGDINLAAMTSKCFPCYQESRSGALPYQEANQKGIWWGETSPSEIPLCF